MNGTRKARVRCITCRALVAANAVDPAGQCDSCAGVAGAQMGLFPVKPWKHTKRTARKAGGSVERSSRMGGGRRGR